MPGLTYALVTPSYWMDLERCSLLMESIERWVPADIRHYLVVARRDVHLFRPLLRPRSSLIVVEDVIPRWLFRVPGIRRFWISLRTRPVKNWILQQIVKLSVPRTLPEEVLLYADSDMFFVSPYDPRGYERDGKVPLFMETGQRGLIAMNDEWQAVASRMLGLPAETGCDTNYIGQLVCWRRGNVELALERVEQHCGTEWPRVVARLSGFSEYTLYGVHATRILNESNSGHWHDPVVRTHNYWRTSPLDVPGLEEFKSKRSEFQYGAMISAKSGTKVEDIRRVFFD